MHRNLATALTAVMVAAFAGTAFGQEGEGPIRATTEDGEEVLLYEDGRWEWAEPDVALPYEGDDASGAAAAESGADANLDEDAPAVLELRELISVAHDIRGDAVSISGQIRCFSQTECDVVQEEGTFYMRDAVGVSIAGLAREERQTLMRECGRFDPRCPATIVGMVDFNRYDSLVLRAETVDW